jgi:LasA protease
LSGRRRPGARWARTAGTLLGLAGALALFTPAGAAADEGSTSAPVTPSARVTPSAAVTERLLDRAGTGLAPAESEPRVNVTRKDGNWAFGTAVLATRPGSAQMPQGWLFLAEREHGKWTVAFEGEERFAALSEQAPVVRTEEKALFAAQDGNQPNVLHRDPSRGDGQPAPLAAGGDFRTGMALPKTTGGGTYMSSGPHGWNGAAAPWSSIDLIGGDEVVRAARQGTAYTMCKGWIRVIHDRGYATDYYHLWSNINTNGGAVNSGAFLGYTGTDVTCGGAASGRHVHFGLRQNGGYIGIAGHNVGKWVLHNGGSAYQGSALHGSHRVHAGGALHNYGALGFTQGVVDTFGGSSLNKRSGPGTGYAVSGSVADGATVNIACSANGTTHTGRYGTTSLWNRLSDGTWISDAFLWTGVGGPVNGTC